MMTTLIALFILFAIPFGVFVGLYEDSRDKIRAYVAARLMAAVARCGDVGNVLCARQSELSFYLPILA